MSGRAVEGADKFGRWRSPAWLEFVRSLVCRCGDPRCPTCSPWSATGSSRRVVAAHLRAGWSGVGVKPDDFLAYPLTDEVHRAFHGGGQPGAEWQLERVAESLRAGFARGVLVVCPGGRELDGR